jgi:hypothetical protein
MLQFLNNKYESRLILVFISLRDILFLVSLHAYTQKAARKKK